MWKPVHSELLQYKFAVVLQGPNPGLAVQVKCLMACIIKNTGYMHVHGHACTRVCVCVRVNLGVVCAFHKC